MLNFMSMVYIGRCLGALLRGPFRQFLSVVAYLSGKLKPMAMWVHIIGQIPTHKHLYVHGIPGPMGAGRGGIQMSCALQRIKFLQH